MVVALKAPVLAVPESGTEPLKPPEAEHEVALVDDHVSVLLPPLVTEVGDADNDTVGAGGVVLETETVVLACAVAPK